MHYRPAVFPVLALVAVLLAGCNSDDKPKVNMTTTTTRSADTPLAVEDVIEVDVTAKVKAIDLATRVVTLEDAGGHEVTLAVDESVRRLNEVKVGDDVSAHCKATLLAELRAPTAEEAATPMAAVSIEGRAEAGSEPAGVAARAIRVVTTVEGVDVPGMLVTLRGPMGDLFVVRGRERENVKSLKVGDTIVITYAESVAMSLQKLESR